jgi:hypothetical protein
MLGVREHLCCKKKKKKTRSSWGWQSLSKLPPPPQDTNDEIVKTAVTVLFSLVVVFLARHFATLEI